MYMSSGVDKVLLIIKSFVHEFIYALATIYLLICNDVSGVRASVARRGEICSSVTGYGFKQNDRGIYLASAEDIFAGYISREQKIFSIGFSSTFKIGFFSGIEGFLFH